MCRTLNIFHRSAVPPGEYYLIANVDDSQGTRYLTEVDESNNAFARAITITKSNIDLEIPEIQYAYTMPGGGSYMDITVSFSFVIMGQLRLPVFMLQPIFLPLHTCCLELCQPAMHRSMDIGAI